MYDKPLGQLREEIDVENTGLRSDFLSPKVYGFLRTYDRSKGDAISDFIGTPQTDLEFQYAATALRTAQKRMAIQAHNKSYERDLCALTNMLDGGFAYFDNKTAFMRIPIEAIKSGIDYKKLFEDTGLDGDYIHGTPISKIIKDLRQDGLEHNGGLTKDFVYNRLGDPSKVDDKLFVAGVIYSITGTPLSSSPGCRDSVKNKVRNEVTLDTAVKEELACAIALFETGTWRAFRF